MTELSITAIDATTVGAVVAGVHLAQLDEASWRGIEVAFHEHAVLVFPGQHLTDAEQVAFASRFGALEDVAGFTGVTPITNVTREGRFRSPDEPSMQILRGNEGWHTDSSYLPVSAKASMLSARVVPGSGGTTEWADMRAAYDELPVAMKQRLDTLSAFHSIKYSQAKIGFTDTSVGSYGFDVVDLPRRPRVTVHPVTGRSALFIGRHAYGVNGLSEAESESLLADLLDHACRSPRTYEHQWVPGDLVMWDNRCVLHRARPYNPTEPRVMHHTRVAGDALTERAINL